MPTLAQRCSEALRLPENKAVPDGFKNLIETAFFIGANAVLSEIEDIVESGAPDHEQEGRLDGLYAEVQDHYEFRQRQLGRTSDDDNAE